MPRRGTLPRKEGERFDKWLLRNSTVEANDPEACWIWTGPVNRQGYGRVRFNGDRYLAHQVSYKVFIGEIPEGHQVNHHCDNPPCIRPSHLYCGTQLENIKDMVNRGRGRAARGSEHHNSSITEAQARAIKRLLEGGQADPQGDRQVHRLFALRGRQHLIRTPLEARARLVLGAEALISGRVRLSGDTGVVAHGRVDIAVGVGVGRLVMCLVGAPEASRAIRPQAIALALTVKHHPLTSAGQRIRATRGRRRRRRCGPPCNPHRRCRARGHR